MKSKYPRRKRKPQTQDKKAFINANQKVQTKEDAFFQTKLDVGKPGDRFEQEADAVADQVAKQDQQQHTSGDSIRKKQLQKQAEEEEPAAKLQKQAEEEEPAAKLQKQAEEEEPAAKLQRKAKQSVQAKANSGQSMKNKDGGKAKEAENPAIRLEAMIKKSKGKGLPLPDDVLADMENKLQADFSKVRIHTDAEAIKMAQMIKAQAFTHGYDIYFNKGKYNPYSSTGKHLLVHELTHVVQQKGK